MFIMFIIILKLYTTFLSHIILKPKIYQWDLLFEKKSQFIFKNTCSNLFIGLKLM